MHFSFQTLDVTFQTFVSIRVINEQLNIPGNAMPIFPQTVEHIDMLRGIAA